MTEPEEEKGYEVVDKRKVKIGENGEVETRPDDEQTQAEAGSDIDQEEMARLAEELSGLPPVDVYSMLRSFISMLGMQTWQWLGLMKNPVTGNMEKDLSQARIAIDTISTLIGQLEPHVEQAEQRELRNLISDLRMNFVQQSARE